MYTDRIQSAVLSKNLKKSLKAHFKFSDRFDNGRKPMEPLRLEPIQIQTPIPQKTASNTQFRENTAAIRDTFEKQLEQSSELSLEEMKEMFNVEDDLRIKLIKALLGDEDSEEFEENIERMKQIGAENLEAVKSAANQPLPERTRLHAVRVSAETMEMTVRGDDGSELRVRYNRVEAEEVTVETADPLVLDLDGDGLELSDVKEGTAFDITGDGEKEKTAFVAGGDAFLAIDHNLNGVIDSGKELFGDQHGARNGFEELRKYDENLDNLIDQQDTVYKKLLLYREDAEKKQQLVKIADFGIASISLDYTDADIRSGGNRISQLSSYQMLNGTSRAAGDAWLNYLA